MRNIYLVRHGMPYFPNGEKYCIGQSDFILSKEGQIQCILLKHGAKELFSGKSFFCSRLIRARDTATILTSEPVIVEGLEEMHAGLWDGLCFSEIEKRWPDIFAARSDSRNLPIPGAENMSDGLSRFKKAVKRCLEMSEGDIVIVAHSTVIQAFLSNCASTPLDECRSYNLPYCSVSKIVYERSFHVEYYGKIMQPEITAQLVDEIKTRTGADISQISEIIQHSV